MPREQLQLLAGDVDRLLAAGAAVAAGDEKLRQRGQRLRELGQKVPVLAQIADAVDRAVNSAPKQVTPALLDLLLVVRQVRAGLASAGADGAAEPVPPSGPWASAMPTRELEGVLENLASSDYDRPRVLKKALKRDDFTDLRLVGPLLRALNTTHHGLGRLLAEKAVPAFGKAMVPELEATLNLKGKTADARRLLALCALDAEKGMALCRQALADGSVPVKIQGLKSLSRLAPAETEKAALALLEQKAATEVQNAAYFALATGTSDEAIEALVACFISPRGEDFYAVHESLVRQAHPKTTARLLEELTRALEDLRARQAAKGKKKAAVKGGKAKGKTAQAKEAQKEARLLQEAIDRVARLAYVLGMRKDRKAVPALIELLGHANANPRMAAGNALLGLGDPDGLRAVAGLLGDKQLWHVAVQAAWRLPGKERFDFLAPAVGSLSQAKAGQRAVGENVLNLFLGELNQLSRDDEYGEAEEDDGAYDVYDDEFEDDEQWEEEEGTPLPRITDWDPRWVPALRKHLNGPSRGGVAIALAVLQGEKIVPELLKILPAAAAKNVWGVIHALAMLRVRQAVPTLVKAFLQKTGDAYTIYNALRQIGDPSAIPPLREYLRKAKESYKKNLAQELVEELEKRAEKATAK
jgi:HEAT repeat protein